MLETRSNALEYFLCRSRFHQSCVEIRTPALHLIEPRAVAIRIARAIQFLEQRAQQAFLLGASQASNLVFDI